MTKIISKCLAIIALCLAVSGVRCTTATADKVWELNVDETVKLEENKNLSEYDIQDAISDLQFDKIEFDLNNEGYGDVLDRETEKTRNFSFKPHSFKKGVFVVTLLDPDRDFEGEETQSIRVVWKDETDPTSLRKVQYDKANIWFAYD